MAINQTLKGLSDQRKAFVFNLCDRGLTIRDSAKEAGYTVANPKYLISDPAVAAAIHERMLQLFRAEDAPMARQVLKEIMLDKDANVKARIECAKALLNRGGFVEPKAVGSSNDAVMREPGEMTGQELQDAISRLQREVGTRAIGAKIVDSDVVEVSEEQQAIDSLI